MHIKLSDTIYAFSDVKKIFLPNFFVRKMLVAYYLKFGSVSFRFCNILLKILISMYT